MTHEELVAHFINDMKGRGIGAYTAAPAAFRMLWRLGVEVPPPHFASFWMLTLFMGVFFGVFWGLIMWAFVWRDMPIALVLISAGLGGLLFGLAMAAYYRWHAGKLGLPRWEDYPAPQA
jgi:hypothetical protein